MTPYLEKVLNHENLSNEEAYSFIHAIDSGALQEAEIGGVLIALRMKGLQLSELEGFRDALLELCVPVEFDASNAIDVCGTGGDGKNTFNISTSTAVLLSTMGIPVVKHGNYGVSSLCGSSNVLESMGVKFTDDQSQLEKQLKENNICFIHAPIFHPTMKKVAPVRKSLATRTVFNCLGPLVNPAQPGYQLTGTFNLDLMRLYSHLLRDKRIAYSVVHNLDGYDEVTLTDSAEVVGNKGQFIVNADQLGVPIIPREELYSGNTVDEAANIFLNLLKGEGTQCQERAVAVNVAIGLRLFHPNEELKTLFDEALKVIQSGQGYTHFQKVLA